jgi:hypothetical protein
VHSSMQAHICSGQGHHYCQYCDEGQQYFSHRNFSLSSSISVVGSICS